MDLNEFLKDYIAGVAPAVGQARDRAGFAAARAAETVGTDLNTGVGVLNDPRNSWIGTNPVGKAVTGGGLGLAALLGQIVYHGSPHRFDKFLMSKVGTGEGAQAYGHGLYFAENPEVARQYAQKLPARDFQRKVQEAYSEYDHPNDAIAALQDAGLSPEQMNLMKALEQDDWLGFDYPHQAIQAVLSKDAKNWDPSPETLDAAKALSNLYTVDLPDEAIVNMLDLDHRMSEQPQFVQDAVMRLLKPHMKPPKIEPVTGSSGGEWGHFWVYRPNIFGSYTTFTEFGRDKALAAANESPMMEVSGRDVKTALGKWLDKQNVLDMLTGTNQGQAEAALFKEGIPGLKYYDAMSRTGESDTRNFVVFDENLPVIKERR